ITQATQRYGLNLYTTYGMSETCGGCVYNGTPLPGVTVDTVEHNGVDRLRVTGPMVAAGYFDDPQLTAKHFQNGSYLTDDYGAVDDVVRVHGRLDDVMNTGGFRSRRRRFNRSCRVGFRKHSLQVSTMITGASEFAQPSQARPPSISWPMPCARNSARRRSQKFG